MCHFGKKVHVLCGKHEAKLLGLLPTFIHFSHPSPTYRRSCPLWRPLQAEKVLKEVYECYSQELGETDRKTLRSGSRAGGGATQFTPLERWWMVWHHPRHRVATPRKANIAYRTMFETWGKEGSLVWAAFGGAFILEAQPFGQWCWVGLLPIVQRRQSIFLNRSCLPSDFLPKRDCLQLFSRRKIESTNVVGVLAV